LRWKTVLAGGLGAVAILATTGCGTVAPIPSPSASPTFPVTGDSVLRIGTIFPTTGASSFIGPAQVAGVTLAVREINEAGGYNGNPVEEFDRNSGDATTQTAEASLADLIEKKVDVVIGPSSSVLAQRLIGPASEAKVPLISPAATFPVLTGISDLGYFFRTIPSYADQGAALTKVLTEKGPRSVSYVYQENDLSSALLESLTITMKASSGSTFTAVKFDSTTTDFADVVATVVKASPDAVVLATPGDAVDQTKAVIAALTSAGFGGAKLWLTSQNLSDYSQALPAGMLDGANGVLEGAQPDAAFVARLKQIDPGLVDVQYAAEAYDATVLAALAAVVAKDDGGPAIARTLQSVSVGGIKCTSFGECIDVLRTESDIDFDGISGPVNLTTAGDVASGSFGIFHYSADNKYALASVIIAP
jgi:branched-chain amino acid transport system substrate-binding protein